MPNSKDYPPDEPLPGSERSANEAGMEGASTKEKSDGGTHVTVHHGKDADNPERYSYDVDKDGNYKPGSGHYTDNSSKKTSGGKPW